MYYSSEHTSRAEVISLFPLPPPSALVLLFLRAIEGAVFEVYL